MKRTYTQTVAIIIALLCTAELGAQFQLSGEFRPRSEYSHGYKTLAASDQHASFFTSQRTRIVFDFSGEKLKTGLVLQDVRLWGSQPQLVGNQDFATSIHQAWMQYSFLPELSLKAGRQELVYDNSRIFGNVGWAQQGRSHDLFLLKYEGALSVHTGIAYNEDANRTNNFYFGPDAYKTLQYIWAQKKSDNLAMSLLFLNNGISVPKDTVGMGPISEQTISFSQTVGPVITYTKDKFGITLESYYQGGKDAGEKAISAWYGRLEGSLKMSKIQLSAGYEYLSGTEYDELTTNNSFTPFYGTNHKFNGYMDYFYVGNHMNSVGLQDIFVKVKANLGTLSLGADAHIFNTSASLAADSDPYLGTEIDLVCSWKLAETFSITAGYSHLLPGNSMSLLKGAGNIGIQNWAWLMLAVKPVFL